MKIEGIVDFDLFLPTAHYQPGGLRNLSVGTYSYLSSNDLILHLRSIGNGIFSNLRSTSRGRWARLGFRNPLTAAASDYQLGPSVQALFKLAYHLDRARTINAGIEGFFDFQYRDDRMDGSIIQNSAERSHMVVAVTAVFAGFPAYLSVLREFDVRNRPEGTRFTAIVYRVSKTRGEVGQHVLGSVSMSTFGI